MEVSDYGLGAPAVQPTEATQLNGRGLQLVAALAADWGTTPNDAAGKTVWFETPL